MQTISNSSTSFRSQVFSTLSVAVILALVACASDDASKSEDDGLGELDGLAQCPLPDPRSDTNCTDELPSGACSADAPSCQAGVRYRCPNGVCGAGYHYERCDCVSGQWTCKMVGDPGASACSPSETDAAAPDAATL